MTLYDQAVKTAAALREEADLMDAFHHFGSASRIRMYAADLLKAAEASKPAPRDTHGVEITDEALQKPCYLCQGSGERWMPPRNDDTFGRSCPDCGGTGKQSIPGARLAAPRSLGDGKDEPDLPAAVASRPPCENHCVKQQVDCDLRIIAQRDEIKRLAAELATQKHECDTWRRSFLRRKEWMDRDSAFWKINTLECRNLELGRRIMALQDLLRGSVSDRSAKRVVIEAMKEFVPLQGATAVAPPAGSAKNLSGNTDGVSP